jgi:16S rRNA (guanine527-N7)-methyltransferase
MSLEEEPGLGSQGLNRPVFEILEEAQQLGLIGPGPIASHWDHGSEFASILRSEGVGRSVSTQPGEGFGILDLGSGGGIPGLSLAELLTASNLYLLDSSERRCDLLSHWVEEAGLKEVVSVLCGRAETLGRDPALRGSFNFVVARLFGSPAVTAECGAPFLRQGGMMVVSDPPPKQAMRAEGGEAGNRWNDDGLAVLGLRRVRTITSPYHFTLLQQENLCPDRFPRRTGMPAKRPLF